MDGVHNGECYTVDDFPQKTIYFEKCKKQRPFRKNLGQERLERIRLNYNKTRKLHGKLEKLNSQESAFNFTTASENNFHLEKLMPGVLHVLERAPQEEDVTSNLCDNENKSEVKNDSESKKIICKQLTNRTNIVEQSATTHDNWLKNQESCSGKYPVNHSNIHNQVFIDARKSSPSIDIFKTGKKRASRCRFNSYSAANRLEKARLSVKRKLNEINSKKLFYNSIKSVADHSVVKQNSIDKSTKQEEIRTRKDAVLKISLKTFPAENSNRSIREQIPKEIINSGSPVVSVSDSQNYDAEDMSMDVDTDYSKLDECIPTDLSFISEKCVQSSSLLFDEWPDESSSVNIVNDEIQKLRQDPKYTALHENFVPDVEMHLVSPSGDILIVIDTNIFLSHLSFIKLLLNCKISTYTSPMLVILWPVIQEIDYAMKKNNFRLSAGARSANNFIFDCLKKQHPRFFGQSFVDFKDNFKNTVSVDDYILQYCLQIRASRNNVILLTDDKNLGSKSMFCHLPVFTKKEFESAFGLEYA